MSGTAAFRVVFVVMPMLGLARPAIGVSLLSALLRLRGHLASTMYLNWSFAERLGYEDYRACGDWRSLPHEALPGEVVFRSALAGPVLPHPFDTGEYAATWALDDERMTQLQRIRRVAEDFVAEMARLPVWDGADLVGFTSSFEQNVASLALARRLKERRPDLPIAFGGANWEGEMGRTLLAEHEFVDFACTGEGDTAFPDLVDELARGEPAPAVAGIAARRGAAAPGPRDLVTDLDSLPPPDYTDYFDTVRASPLRPEVSPVLLVQTARGCWFGERSHCSFCGLNGSTLTFRSKSPERAAREILDLSAAFGVTEVDTVDEIMDMRYLDRMLPVLADRAPADLRLFYEVKANLSHDQVATMRAGRVTNVQPGIETLSDRVLRLMRKGTTTAKNVEFLKWCVEHDVTVYWNLLYGIPGEQLTDYTEIIRVIRAIRWLPPPTGGAVRLRLDRFSPYHSDPAAFGISDLRPSVAYRHAYGDRPPDVLAGIAYYFTGEYSSHAASPAADALRRSVQHWLADSDRGRLTVRRIDEEALEITDTRPGTGDRVIREYGWRAALLRLLDVGRKWETVRDWCVSRDVGAGDARRLLAEHLRAGTLLRAGGRYVTLAVHTPACPAPAPWPGAGPGPGRAAAAHRRGPVVSADPQGADPSAAGLLATEGELRAAADGLFAGIWRDCRTCTDPDCVGYIWTVPSEQDRLLDGGLRLVELNGAGGPVFVDSYRRGPQGQVQVGDYRPRCPYLTGDGRCGVHATRPLSCHLYPLAPEWTTGGLRWVLHTDCNHVRRLSATGGLPALLAVCRATLARISPELRAEIVQTLTTVATVSTVRRAYDCFVVVADV